MNWDAIGAIAESIGAVAVVGTLVFVGFQIQQSTKALRSTALREVLRDMMGATKQLSEDSELSRLWWDGLADLEALSNEEQRRFAAYAANICRSFENVLHETTANHIAEEQWKGLREALRMQVRQPGFLLWWFGSAERHGASNLFNEELQHFVRGIADESHDA